MKRTGGQVYHELAPGEQLIASFPVQRLQVDPAEDWVRGRQAGSARQLLVRGILLVQRGWGSARLLPQAFEPGQRPGLWVVLVTVFCALLALENEGVDDVAGLPALVLERCIVP